MSALAEKKTVEEGERDYVSPAEERVMVRLLASACRPIRSKASKAHLG
jgi:hypothetical protein